MKRKKGISVIVPVYNVEKYLRECLQSFVDQTLITEEKYEVLIVNDGTPDNSMDIAKEFEIKYPKIFKILEKENGGLSDARNFGISNAKMEYITFVDSDDWVEKEYIYTLSKYINQNIDVLIFDAIKINDGWKTGEVINTFKGAKKTIGEFVKESTNPSFACARMYNYKLFEKIKFPKPDIWYEDIATIPIVLSHSNEIEYIEKPLYYYRQREESITMKSLDERNLEIITGLERVLNKVNKKYLKEAEYAVYFTINSFLSFRPKFAKEYIEFVKKHRKTFKKNEWIVNDIENENIENIFDKDIIPKKIHYFWFGNNPKSELIMDCIESWKKFAPDYEIVEWNEKNCDIKECRYVEEAYKAKKWAFVSDYFRTKIIYENGGIYLDTDMELTKPIDFLTLHTSFFHFETENVAAGIFGALPKNEIMNEWFNSYKNDKFVLEDGTFNTENTIVKRLTKILDKKYDIKYNCENQFFDDGVAIYAPDYLMIDVYNGNNVAIHHYDASWWDSKVGVRSYKYDVLEYFFLQKLCNKRTISQHLIRGLSNLFRGFVFVLRKLLPEGAFLKLKKLYRKIIGRS